MLSLISFFPLFPSLLYFYVNIICARGDGGRWSERSMKQGHHCRLVSTFSCDKTILHFLRSTLLFRQWRSTKRGTAGRVARGCLGKNTTGVKFSIAMYKRASRSVFHGDLHTTFSITAFNFFVCQSWGGDLSRSHDRFRRIAISFYRICHSEDPSRARWRENDAPRPVVDFNSFFLCTIKKHGAGEHCAGLMDF